MELIVFSGGKALAKWKRKLNNFAKQNEGYSGSYVSG